MRGSMFPDGPPVEIGGRRKISCPSGQPHQFKEQSTDHPLQGGPVIEAPIIKRKLKVKWGCTGLSDVYKSACPLCDGTIMLDRISLLDGVKQYNVRTKVRAKTGAWHRCGEHDEDPCPIQPLLYDLGKFVVDVEAVNRTSVPWWAYYGFEDAVTDFLREKFKEELGIDV